MNELGETSKDITNINPTARFSSELGEAWTALRSGNDWPLALLEARAGNKKRLAAVLRRDGLIAGSDQANVVADMLEGKFRSTKKDYGKEREYEILSLVSFYNMVRAWFTADPEQFNKKPSTDFPVLRALDDVYVHVAAELDMERDAVEKVVTRNRSRLKSLVDNRTKPLPLFVRRHDT